jgi:hypothetical protein
MLVSLEGCAALRCFSLLLVLRWAVVISVLRWYGTVWLGLKREGFDEESLTPVS